MRDDYAKHEWPAKAKSHRCSRNDGLAGISPLAEIIRRAVGFHVVGGFVAGCNCIGRRANCPGGYSVGVGCSRFAVEEFAKAPTFKFQAPEKLQISICKQIAARGQSARLLRVVEIWCLELLWGLEVEAWCFAPLHSQLQSQDSLYFYWQP